MKRENVPLCRVAICSFSQLNLELWHCGNFLIYISLNSLRGRGVKGRGRGGWMSRGGLRGGRGMMKGFGPPGHGRGRMKDGAMNGLAPMRYFTYQVCAV